MLLKKTLLLNLAVGFFSRDFDKVISTCDFDEALSASCSIFPYQWSALTTVYLAQKATECMRIRPCHVMLIEQKFAISHLSPRRRNFIDAFAS